MVESILVNRFSPSEVAAKIAVSLGIGLLVGIEREWSNKDLGARALTALLGTVAALFAPSMAIVSFVGVFLIVIFANARSLQTSQPLRDIAGIMLDTGMRPEEVFRIRIENIDFKQKTIFNPFGKTKAARRTIPMTDDVACLLKSRIKKLEEKGTPFVFPSPYDFQRPIGSVKKAHRLAA